GPRLGAQELVPGAEDAAGGLCAQANSAVPGRRPAARAPRPLPAPAAAALNRPATLPRPDEAEQLVRAAQRLASRMSAARTGLAPQACVLFGRDTHHGSQQRAEPPRLDSPVVVAALEGWNDAGDAAISAIEHLQLIWDAMPL